MRFNTLKEWLSWQETLHSKKIDLTLSRCQTVAKRLDLLNPDFPVITVGGTNGKGSSVTFLDSILIAAEYRTGRSTSPHLVHYNERICIAGKMVEDDALCQAFAAIDEARQNISLTYFEFNTLATLYLFKQQKVDIAILEVGLGGRFDAANIVDPTIALITSIDLDHTDWLGDTREKIGFEKAGIFRPQQSAVCADPNPPKSVLNHAKQLGTILYCQNREFNYIKKEQTWQWHSELQNYHDLPLPSLHGDFQLQNASGVLMALNLLVQKGYPVSEKAIHYGLTHAQIAGRCQIIEGDITQILDVTHNVAGANALRENLEHYIKSGRVHAVVGMLKDKDIKNVFATLQDKIDEWHVSPLDTARSATKEQLVTTLQDLNITQYTAYSTILAAYNHALEQAEKGDYVIVFGSFYTVSAVLNQDLQTIEKT